MEIRALKKSDYPKILEIYNYYIENTLVTLEYDKLTIDEFTVRLDRISAKYPFLVAVDNGQVVGYAYLDKFNERKGYRYTADLSIYVDKNFHRKGYGTALAKELFRIAEKSGYKNIISIVSEKNLSSIEFHKSLGFEVVGRLIEVAEKFDEPMDIILLQGVCRKLCGFALMEEQYGKENDI